VHYQRWQKHADPLYVAPPRERVIVCTVAGCDLAVKATGLCSKHHTRLLRYGVATARLKGEVVDGKRICPGCGEDKPLTDYSPHRGTKSGLQVYCKPCSAARTAAGRRRPGWTRSPRDPEQDRQYACRWRAANPEKVKATHDAYKARKRGALVEQFPRIEIFDRDGWMCHICRTAIDPATAYPHPLSASLDHVFPLVRGGTHSRANVAAAHLTCNSSKKDRVW
jgi:hypothetical protein